MIFVRGKIASEAEAHYVVMKTASGYVIRFKQSKNAVTQEGEPASALDRQWEFDASKVEYAPDIMYVTRDIWGNGAVFWQSEIGHNRDGYASIGLRKKIRLDDLQSCFAMVAIEENGQHHMIVYGDVCVLDDVPVTVIPPETPGTGCDIFEANIPGVREFMKHSRAKVSALARFNAVDAISGLENQIDLLTSAVAALMAEFPADKRPAWWGQFEAVVAANSSNNLRGEQKGISNVEAEKVKAREIQNTFFTKLTNG